MDDGMAATGWTMAWCRQDGGGPGGRGSGSHPSVMLCYVMLCYAQGATPQLRCDGRGAGDETRLRGRVDVMRRVVRWPASLSRSPWRTSLLCMHMHMHMYMHGGRPPCSTLLARGVSHALERAPDDGPGTTVAASCLGLSARTPCGLSPAHSLSKQCNRIRWTKYTQRLWQ